MKVAYSQESDNAQYLKGSMVVRVKRYAPLPNAAIEISRFENDKKLVIGKTTTNANGEFSYMLEANIEDWMNDDGEVDFSVEYQGNDTIRRASRSLKVIPAYLGLEFKQLDDEYIVEVQVLNMNSNGQKIPSQATDIGVYVRSLFNPLLIGSETTDSFGIARVEFPNDLPGDRDGNISVLVQINEHDRYGTVSQKGQVKWGIPYSPPEVRQRGLGDTDAPLWMVYTLIVLLSAVWFHYLYVIYMILRIKLSR